MKNRNNAFDLIRHFAAFLVLFSHQHALLGLPEPTFPHWDSLGFVAVVIFFAISGYLMPQSFTNSGNFLLFMEKRCRRIFPAMIACSIFMCYVLGPLFTPEPVLNYLFDPSNFKTCLLFSTFMGRPIPGVFSDFLFKNAINGSIWTLPVEFSCYIIIAVALFYSNSLKSVLTLVILSILATMFFTQTGINYMFYAVPLNYLAIFGIAFSVGALMSMTQSYWFHLRLLFTAIALLFLLTMQGRPEMQVLGTLSLAVLTVIIGVSFKDRWIRGRFDLSYGIYIYAFPIQQLVINLVTQHFWLSFLLSVFFTLIVAYFSYHYVEKRFLYANVRKAKEEMHLEPPNPLPHAARGGEGI